MSDTKVYIHERHRKYIGVFRDLVNQYEYLSTITDFVLDPLLSPNNIDDIDFFQDLIFNGRFGRVHIYYYELLFVNGPISSKNKVEIFSKYLDYLDKISKLFTIDALRFFLKETSPFLIETLLKELPLDHKLQMIRLAESYPNIIRTVPKLKLYNLFS